MHPDGTASILHLFHPDPFKPNYPIIWMQLNMARGHREVIQPTVAAAASASTVSDVTGVAADTAAGYVVRDRRSKLLSTNVNKFIFLHQNAKSIPETTPVIEIN